MNEADDAIQGETDFFRPFPEPHEVFASQVERHSEFLLPLATVSLKHISPEWAGVLPFVMPIEPGPGWGALGERSTSYHNYLCRENWVGYRVVEGKLEFAGDWRYFHKAYFSSHPPGDALAMQEQSELTAHYRDSRAAYQMRKDFFRKHGFLTLGDVADSTANPAYLADELGGYATDGNWAATDFPLSKRHPPELSNEEQTEQEELLSTMKSLSSGVACEYLAPDELVAPMTEDGREFVFIGAMYMHIYGGGDGGILLFYDPKVHIALTTFDWT